MIIIIPYIIISFLLDGLISNYVSINIISPSYLRTIYTIISIVITYHYFDNNKKYIIILLILGLLFDIVYTNTFPLNIVIFFVLYLLLKQMDYYIPNNLLTINIKSIICITTYHILTYIILLLTHYNNYTINLLFTIIFRSIIMTIIYTTISYLIINKLYNKKYYKLIK